MSEFLHGTAVKVFSGYTNQYHTGYTVILDMPRQNVVVVSHRDDNKPHAVSRARVEIDETPESPKQIPKKVCLCGSTRFSEAFQQANLNETLAGRIVLTIGCDMRSDADIFADKSEEELTAIKAGLDELHLRKIDISDEVLILNVGGYIGESTRRELEYAKAHGKHIRFLESNT